MESKKNTFSIEEDTSNKIDIILRQTDYNVETAKTKLLNANMDHIKVIKDYFGIPEKKETNVSSVQQQIYKEIRHRLDDSMREYNNKQNNKLKSEIENINK